MILDRQLESTEILKRIASEYLAPRRKLVFIAIIFMIVTAICTATVVYLIKPAIDEVFINRDEVKLITIPLLMFGVYAIKGIAEFFQNYFIKFLGQDVLTNMQMQMYEHLLKADFLFIQSQSSGRLISRFTNDITLMRGAVSNTLIGCAKHLITVIFLIILMFNLDLFLSLFVFLAFPAAILPVQRLGRKMRSVTSSAQEELGNLTAKLDETLRSPKVVKSFCAEEKEAKHARDIAQRILKFYRKSAKFDSLTSPVMEILSGLAVSFVVWYGGTQVIEGNLTAGAIFSFISAFVAAYRPFKSLLSLNVSLQEGIAAGNRIFNMLDFQPEIKDHSNARIINMNNPQITFDDIRVNFGEKSVIKSFNLVVDPGKTYALIGRSGSGKTTIANLLVRFFDPSHGRVAIDGTDIRDISLKNLRSNISMVTQDIILFDSTVAENIAYGQENAKREDIIKAAKAADAHEFIEALPNGYDTLVGVSGSTLSGGQKQRLSIARAFLKDSPILLLDEATSSLDPKAEQSIVGSIKRLRESRTTLIITHRLSSITDADQIVVMKKGEIVEQGTHNKLLKNRKEYYTLYNKELKDTDNSV